jgi:hypothetical protein
MTDDPMRLPDRCLWRDMILVMFAILGPALVLAGMIHLAVKSVALERQMDEVSKTLQYMRRRDQTWHRHIMAIPIPDKPGAK